ncbi:MFS transporter [Limnochorda pilosa]|uniref:MFS transporter n=1 Tax=Limnochorda pilosa TaxID=1555112 RepID=UPI000833FC83|nr:MFS transporter [Limnochorda pilosa]
MTGPQHKALGALISAHAAGSIVGAALYAAVGPRFSRRWVYLTAWLVAAVPQLALAQLPPLPFMIGLAVLMGLGSGPLNPIIYTVMQERVPLEMRARVFGMTRALAWMAMPLGPMIGGYAAEATGLRGAYTVIAVTYLLVALAQFLVREMKAMDLPPDSALRAARGWGT